MKPSRIFPVMLVAVAAAGAVALGNAGRSGAAAKAPSERLFEFSYAATVLDVPKGAKKVDLWMPYPKNDESQTVFDVRIDSRHPARPHYDREYGNGILHVVAEGPGTEPPGVVMRFKVRRREVKSPGRDEGEAGRPLLQEPDRRFLLPDRLVTVDGNIKKLAEKITAGKTGDLEKARAIYDYVAGFMNYDKSGTGWGNGDTQFCLREARGNCTDYHSLFLSLSRSVGIPAKFEIGFHLPEERGGGEISGYHCWAKFFDRDRGWVAIDNSEADKRPERRDYYFGGLDENRVLMSVGRDIELAPRQKGERINYFIYPYAEIDGKPHEGVKARFSFRDLKGNESKIAAPSPKKRDGKAPAAGHRGGE